MSVQLVFKISNLCDHNPPTSQTDRQTDDMRSQDRACTKVHSAVRTKISENWGLLSHGLTSHAGFGIECNAIKPMIDRLIKCEKMIERSHIVQIGPVQCLIKLTFFLLLSQKMCTIFASFSKLRPWSCGVVQWKAPRPGLRLVGP